MINNFKQIKELLEFRTDDDFYFIQILQRKKDHKDGKINGTNNNSRLIKAYYIKSVEHLEFVEPEIIELCEIFNARAGINLNRRSFYKMALKNLQKITQQFIDGTYNKVHKSYNSVLGAFNDDCDKKWILDIDEPYETFPLGKFGSFLTNIQPFGNKILATIPSKNGFHIITKPFDLRDMKPKYSEIEIHKNNPTNLYIPNYINKDAI